ncbi:MAG TPA: response regulator [Tepidisphaeraceae bacterium]|nr:response regulator [Tepidisphaeraceae bacterium]
MANLLVVEDDPDNAEVLIKTLRKDGHHVTRAANGWEALIALGERQVDGIVLDLMMPGMNGRTFLNILRRDSRYGHIPVIVVTGAPGIAQGDAVAADLGVVACLIKTSYSAAQLRELVNQTLSSSNTSDSGFGMSHPHDGQPMA